MSTPYTVKAGDWLQKIAEEHGFESWRDLYYHEDNAAFRAKRPDPDKIYPGDVVMIPDRAPGTTPPGGGPPGTTPPGTTPPGEVETVIAQEGDTLCSIAVEHGFADCAPLRPHNPEFDTRPVEAGDEVQVPAPTEGQEAGETEQTHVFERRGTPLANIRFVHGSPTLDFEDDLTLNRLNVSNYVTDKAGAPDGAANWVDHNHRQFDGDAHRDEDTFKVEVLDNRTTETDLEIELEALRPVYDPADPLHETVQRHERFPEGAERTRRSLQTGTGGPPIASRQGTSNRFRTGYLRLVADEADKDGTVSPVAANAFAPQAGHAARPEQTLLVTDMTDQGDGDLQILDQLVRARYVLEGCPGPPAGRCRVRQTVGIGEDRQRVRLALHVLRTTRGGAPLVQTADARRRIEVWVRRAYAQAAIGPKIMQVREVDPVENLISVSEAPFPPPTPIPANTGGRRASGVDGTGNPSQFGFRIRGTLADGTVLAPQVIGPLTPTSTPPVLANSTPLATATALAGLVQAPYTATVSPNPRRFTDAAGSVDILITAGSTATIRGGDAHVRIDQVVSTDNAQTLTVAQANPLPNPMMDWSDRFLVGTIEQRVLLKNYDTGNNVIDLFVITRFAPSADRGEAMMSGEGVTANATFHARTDVEYSVFVIQTTMNAGDNDQLVLPHEIGHVLAEVVHARHSVFVGGATVVLSRSVFQLMCDRVSGNNDVGSSKRIRDGNVRYDGPDQNIDLIQRLRSQGAGRMEAW